jgi:hypothetical protein
VLEANSKKKQTPMLIGIDNQEKTTLIVAI